MTMRTLLIVSLEFCVGLVTAADQPGPKPVPRLQALPEPYHQVSFQRDGVEIARYHFSPDLNRPFVYPLIGPYGRSLTRMGHPGDPDTHAHHYSVWLGFGGVNGVDFWSDHGRQARGRIVHKRVERLEDGNDIAAAVTFADWTTSSGKVLLQEKREVFVKLLPGKEWMLVMNVALDPGDQEVVFDKGVLGPMSVRMAKTIGVHHGGGTIRNSAGGVNEDGVFRKRARWMDYSGQIDNGVIEGLTLMDHPSNPRHPAHFHVRDDGWMGALLTHEASLVLAPRTPIQLRYGVYVHAGAPARELLDSRWQDFATAPLWPPFGPPRSEKDCLHGDHKRYNTPRSFKSLPECLSFVKAGK